MPLVIVRRIGAERRGPRVVLEFTQDLCGKLKERPMSKALYRMGLAAIFLTLGACSSGGPSTLAADCATQAAAIQQAASMVKKLSAAERLSIDGQIALSQPYCKEPPPPDQAAASRVVRGATARIGAVLAVAASR